MYHDPLEGSTSKGVKMGDLNFDPGTTALVLMDFQNFTLEYLPSARESGLIGRTHRVLETCRRVGVKVVFSARTYRAGYPEVNPRDAGLMQKKANRVQEEGSPGAAIIDELRPRPEEPIVPKRRTSAFLHSDLDLILRSASIQTLALAGIATSGAVLSTVRVAADLDYGLVVLEDCCGDGNEEVHNALITSIFPSQATVTSADHFIQALAPSKS